MTDVTRLISSFLADPNADVVLAPSFVGSRFLWGTESQLGSGVNLYLRLSVLLISVQYKQLRFCFEGFENYDNAHELIEFLLTSYKDQVCSCSELEMG